MQRDRSGAEHELPQGAHSRQPLEHPLARSPRLRTRRESRRARSPTSRYWRRLAAIDLLEAGVKDVRLLEGGLAAWTAAGYPAEASAESPPDRECIDYLFFVHDRHAGNREAMKQYLAWETGLIAQLDDQDRTLSGSAAIDREPKEGRYRGKPRFPLLVHRRRAWRAMRRPSSSSPWSPLSTSKKSAHGILLHLAAVAPARCAR